MVIRRKLTLKKIISRGMKLEARGNYQTAKTNYEKALVAHPKNVDLIYRLALCHYKLEDIKKAKEYFLILLDSNPELINVWYNFGLLLQEEGSLNDAIDAYLNVLKIDSTVAAVWHNLGVIYYRCFQHKDAEDAFLNAVKFDSTNGNSWFYLGKVYYDAERLDEAKSALSEALRLNPEDIQSQIVLTLVTTLLEDEQKRKASFPPQPISKMRNYLETKSIIFSVLNQMKNSRMKITRDFSAGTAFSQVLQNIHTYLSESELKSFSTSFRLDFLKWIIRWVDSEYDHVHQQVNKHLLSEEISWEEDYLQLKEKLEEIGTDIANYFSLDSSVSGEVLSFLESDFFFIIKLDSCSQKVIYPNYDEFGDFTCLSELRALRETLPFVDEDTFWNLFDYEEGHITELFLSGPFEDEKVLDHLPECFAEFQHLKSLKLGNNGIQQFPIILFQLPNLSQISIAGNPLGSPLEVMQVYQNLETQNSIMQISPEFITALREISNPYWQWRLFDCSFTLKNVAELEQQFFFDLFRSFDSFENLCIDREVFSKSWFVVEGEHIVELNLGNPRKHGECFGIYLLPKSVGNLSFLKKLNIHNNSFKILPEEFYNLSNLEVLNLSQNALFFLPEAFGNLHSLRILDLSYNLLTVLPDSIGNLKQLESLNLDAHESLSWWGGGSPYDLHYLPNDLQELGEKYLKMLTHKLTIHDPDPNLPISRFVEDFGLKHIPASFGRLQSLKELSLVNNLLEFLPAAFENLILLEKLKLFKTPLSTFPSWITSLVNLKELDLSHSKLSKVPHELAHLKSLRKLRIYSVPIEDGLLEALKYKRVQIEPHGYNYLKIIFSSKSPKDFLPKSDPGPPKKQTSESKPDPPTWKKPGYKKKPENESDIMFKKVRKILEKDGWI